MLEILHGVRRADSAAPAASRRQRRHSTVLMGLFVVSAPFLAGTALILFSAISFALDALGHARTAWSSAGHRARSRHSPLSAT